MAAPGTVSLDALQQEVLGEELAALAASLHDPVARAPYEDLAAAVAAGDVEEEHLRRLEGILEMTLQTGRVRRVHGAQSEQALLRLFQQTPRGAAARRATQAVNDALATLAGQSIEGMLFTVQGPGVYRLGVSTGLCRLTLEIDRHGITVESLEV
ncbi:MAG TPA: hypothetical protein VF173_38555 [Thermoanaerobaculia bacterium]|nr:hypothetical protein [Thermoanaerobaculia bacterium]